MASLSRKGSKHRPKPHMNVTPLVDVVLVLLIIFMIVIPAMEESLNLEVPAVSNPDEEESSENAPEPFMLAVTSNGNVYFNEQRVTGDLLVHLETAHRREPRRRLVLRGDREARYAVVRDLFATAQGVGFPGVSLRVNHTEEDRRDAR